MRKQDQETPVTMLEEKHLLWTDRDCRMGDRDVLKTALVTSKPFVCKVTLAYDECPDTSAYGQFTDTWQPGAIACRKRGRSYSDYDYFVPAWKLSERITAKVQALRDNGATDA